MKNTLLKKLFRSITCITTALLLAVQTLPLNTISTSDTPSSESETIEPYFFDLDPKES